MWGDEAFVPVLGSLRNGMMTMSIGLVNVRRGQPPLIRYPGGAGAVAVRGHPQSPATHLGFTLIEVLVTVIVLAVGLLSMAKLQLSALKSTDSARLRTIATDASYDLADRIRADPGAILGTAALTSLTTLIGTADCTTNLCNSPPTCLQKDFCARGLPESTLVADCSAASGCGAGNCAIIVSWNDARGDLKDLGAPHTPSFSTCIRLPPL